MHAGSGCQPQAWDMIMVLQGSRLRVAGTAVSHCGSPCWALARGHHMVHLLTTSACILLLAWSTHPSRCPLPLFTPAEGAALPYPL